MTDGVRALLEQALKLPEGERESLAYEILHSVGSSAGELSPLWREEIDRRIAKIVSGAAGPGLDWRVAMKEIRREVEEAHRKPR